VITKVFGVLTSGLPLLDEPHPSGKDGRELVDGGEVGLCEELLPGNGVRESVSD
jgi:hypothetical protein